MTSPRLGWSLCHQMRHAFQKIQAFWVDPHFVIMSFYYHFGWTEKSLMIVPPMLTPTCIPFFWGLKIRCKLGSNPHPVTVIIGIVTFLFSQGNAYYESIFICKSWAGALDARCTCLKFREVSNVSNVSNPDSFWLTATRKLAARSEGKHRKNAISTKNLEKQPHPMHVKICPNEGNVYANDYVVWICGVGIIMHKTIREHVIVY